MLLKFIAWSKSEWLGHCSVLDTAINSTWAPVRLLRLWISKKHVVNQLNCNCIKLFVYALGEVTRYYKHIGKGPIIRTYTVATVLSAWDILSKQIEAMHTKKFSKIKAIHFYKFSCKRLQVQQMKPYTATSSANWKSYMQTSSVNEAIHTINHMSSNLLKSPAY